MLENNNIVLIHGFKEYCALLFFKGALLNDPRWYPDATNGDIRRRARSGSPMFGR